MKQPSRRKKNAPLPTFGAITISTLTTESGTLWVTARDSDGIIVGESYAYPCEDGYAPIAMGRIEPWMQGKGLYPVMLTMLRDQAKKEGCKGLVSRGSGRIGTDSTESWLKFAKKETRVQKKKGGSGGHTDTAYFFSGLGAFTPNDDVLFLDGLGKLPKKGRIPLATVKRAAAKLPKWTRKCGFTITQLREGMEVEREHADVTKRGAFKTAQIAAAHLCEFKGGGYYPSLKQLERKLKRSK